MGGNDPLKFSDVFLFVMVTVSLTAPELTGLPVITKKKKIIMQIFHQARQQFLLAGAELSEMPFVVNSFHS